MPSKTRVPLILGTMTFGESGKNGVRIDDPAQVQATIDAFKSHGHTELDTARMYGVGTTEATLAKLDLSSTTLDTKVYPVNPGDHEPAKLRATFETSLKTLGRKSVRILYLHAPDRATPFAETLREVDKLHKEGKFEILGLSNYAAWELAQVCGICDKEGLVRPKVYQGMYNGITRSAEAELFPACRALGLRLVLYNPLAGGFFAGKVTRPDDLESAKGGRFDPSSKMGEMYRARYFKSSYFAALEALKSRLASVPEVASTPLVEVALRWMQHHSLLQPGDGVIIGASSVQQCEQNCAASEKGPLPGDAVKAIDEAWETVKAECPPYWR